jgi:hypothetical protein
MSLHYSQALSRRGFCICCAVAAGLGANGGWCGPAEAATEPRDIVDLIRDYAATAPIQLHKLRGNVTIIEGSGGNIAVLTGAEGKLFVDAGITATRPRILEAVNNLSRDLYLAPTPEQYRRGRLSADRRFDCPEASPGDRAPGQIYLPGPPHWRSGRPLRLPVTLP